MSNYLNETLTAIKNVNHIINHGLDPIDCKSSSITKSRQGK